MPDNKAMLDADALARRLRKAMDEHDPKITGAALASECGVKPQAVSGWRKNGRVHKRHLQKIVAVTGKPLEYFLSSTVPPEKSDGKHNGHHHAKRPLPWANEIIYDEKQFLTLFRAWQDTDESGRGALLGVANAVQRAHAVKRKRPT